MKQSPRITSDSGLHCTTLPIIKHKNKVSAGANPNLAHLGSSAKKFKLSAYSKHKLAVRYPLFPSLLKTQGFSSIFVVDIFWWLLVVLWTKSNPFAGKHQAMPGRQVWGQMVKSTCDLDFASQENLASQSTSPFNVGLRLISVQRILHKILHTAQLHFWQHNF